MRRRSLALLAVVVAACTAPDTRVMLRAGDLDIDGDISVSTGPVKASSSANDLDIDKSGTVLQPRVDFHWDGLDVIASATQADYDGDGVASAAIGPIAIGAPVSTDLELDLYTATFIYEVARLGGVDLGVGGGVGFLRYDLEVRGAALAARTDNDFPMVYLAGRAAYEQGRFDASLLLSGISVSYDDEDLSYYELDAVASYRLFETMDQILGRLMVGYRLIDVDYEYDDGGAEVVLDADFSGPYLGLSFDL